MPLRVPAGTQINPEEDMVLCQMYEESEIIHGTNIIKPDCAREEVFFAKVLKVGPGRTIEFEYIDDGSAKITRKPVPWKDGQDVLFSRYHGERIMVGSELYILLRQDDVIATIDIDETEKNRLFALAGVEMYERLKGAQIHGSEVS